jgi:hypothetical protein
VRFFGFITKKFVYDAAGSHERENKRKDSLDSKEESVIVKEGIRVRTVN